jgi:hypothetical protein
MKYIKYSFFICLSILAIYGLLSFDSNGKRANTGWQAVYKHNENGKPLSGNKQALIDAIRNGYDVKIGWGFQLKRDTSIRLEHTANPHFVTITKNDEVTAIIHEHALLNSYMSDTPKFNLPMHSWKCVLSTTGTFNAMIYDTKKEELVNDFPQRHIMTWFVNYNNQPEKPKKLFSLE